MTERFYSPVIKYTTSNLTSLPGALLYFYETGTSTPKTTWTDPERATASAHPVPALADGTFPPIFINGVYRVELKNAAGVTQPGWPVDDVGSPSSGFPFQSWSSTYRYSEDDLVTYGGEFYQSLSDNNVGNTPSSSPLSWRKKVFLDAPTAASYLNGNADGTYTWRTIAQTKTDLSLPTDTVAELALKAAFVSTFAALGSTPGTAGQVIHTAGHTVSGKGGMTYVAKAGSVTNDGGHNINSSTANVYWSAQVNPAGVSVLEFGAIGDGSNDDTVAIQAAIDYAISKSSLIVLFPAGAYKITDTITIENSLSLVLAGQGERVTTLRFHNAVADKVFFDLTAASSNTHFSDFFIDDNTAGTSTFMKMQDTLPDTDGYSHYKDSTTRCRITDFKTAIHITTDDPLDGATHAFCSEPMFMHTRFKNNRTTFKVENIQAVDITLVGTDIENDDSGEEYTFFRDNVGATYNIYGGSFVGKGIILDCDQPVGSTSLWQAANFSMKDSRLEMRATRTLAMFKPVASSFATEGVISLDNVKILGFTQTLPFVNYGGRTNIVISKSKVLAGTAVITLNPTTGITGALNAGEGYYESFGSIKIDDSFGFSYAKGTSSPYGTYEERYTVPIVVKNYMTSQNGSHSVDDNNFIIQASQNQQQMAVGLGHAESFKMIYNIDRPASGFTDIKFILPNNCTPCKLLMFKHPNVRTTNINIQLAAVKDEASWVTPGTFDYATDAIVLADSVSTTNRMGYMEFVVDITSSHFDAGLYFKSGLGAWTEGRMIFRLTSGAAMQGWVGVEYM